MKNRLTFQEYSRNSRIGVEWSGNKVGKLLKIPYNNNFYKPNKDLKQFLTMPEECSVSANEFDWYRVMRYFQNRGLPVGLTARWMFQSFAHELNWHDHRFWTSFLKYEFSESNHECGVFRDSVFLGTLTRNTATWLWKPGFMIRTHFDFGFLRERDVVEDAFVCIIREFHDQVKKIEEDENIRRFQFAMERSS